MGRTDGARVLILAIESSTPRSSVALAERDVVVASASLGVPQRHGEFLGPALQFCLEQAGASVGDVTGVAVGVGPGLFTGLRVGIATAQTFAAARSLPVVGLSGLDVLAFRSRHVGRLVCTALDARRRELFWAFYRQAPGGMQQVAEPQVGDAGELAAEIAAQGGDCLVVGDGGLRYGDELAAAGADLAGPADAWPDAADLAQLAVPRFLREETHEPQSLQPIYLRRADARIGWQERGRMHGGAG
ncbi:MAG: tRNA (adenosine(37)-N6)-threonylcarbamoyltransferase complex dimerization subunit type 1 TsaB [Actinobacteria bacterium]|nr:tRNA (adenosine(37)-N6)-threonylcarbamoyltransferase complex dimerization subunit type 1 TsaB [Actinomycetota bacterium]